MENISEISFEIKNKLDKIAEEGNKFADDQKNSEAIKIWKKGLEIIPKPNNLYSETIWFQTAIGDLLFQDLKYNEAIEYFDNARSNLSGEGYKNPFIMLRLGECFYELNDKKNAAEYLLRAYMLDGKNIFEYEDNKYFKFLKSIAKDIQ